MPDQLEHALRRKTELLGSRSKAEVAAINLLQAAYEALLPQKSEPELLESRGRIRRPVSARLRPSSPSACLTQPTPSSSSQGGAEAIATFISFAQLRSKLQSTAKQLEAEISVSERKCSSLLADPSSYLPEVDPSEMPPRLQMLLSVLGPPRFHHYIKDLFMEVSLFRRRTGMYGGVYTRVSQQLITIKGGVISANALLAMFGRLEGNDTTSDSVNMPISQASSSTEPKYELLFQHCSDPSNSTKVMVEELLLLLRSIPPTREKLVRHTFEQVSDGWRGEGYTPPPDSIRAHRLRSVLKDSYAHQQCSSKERDAVVRWIDSIDIDGSGNTCISLRDFVEFHNEKSDEFPLEDAEFVRYLLRIWCFDPSNSLSMASSTDRDAVARVIINSDERSIHERLMARKRELVGKVERAQSSVSGRVEQQRLALGYISRLSINSTSISTWWCDQELADLIGAALSGLQYLTASGYSLTKFPAFTRHLERLEVLNLQNNRIVSLPNDIQLLVALQILDLSSNNLCDIHFIEADVTWRLLTVLREIKLSNNRLTTIPQFVCQLPSLDTLDLSLNRIQSISSSVLKRWSGASNILTLDLHHNSIVGLPEDMVIFSKLKSLKLHDNALVSLPSSIGSLECLEELTLTGNKLGGEFRELPVTTHQNFVSLDKNQLQDLPEIRVVGGDEPEETANNVVRISAAYNQIRRLPSRLGESNFERCHELRLEHNNIREIPSALFERLIGLEILVLHHNRLKQLPVTITCCKALRIIDVHSNRITDIPKELSQLTQLESLDMTENLMQEIPVEWHAFRNHMRPPAFEDRMLRTLALRRNPIQNAVLKTIIDGSTDMAQQIASTLSSSNVKICEGVLKKLIAGLRDVAPMKLACEGFPSDSSDDDTIDVRGSKEKRSAPKWRGLTRDVILYIEMRLRSINLERGRGKHGKNLLVDIGSFERMIKRLPFACSKIELEALVKRLSEKVSPTSQCINGQAFLELIDTFGNQGSLSSLGACKAKTQGDQVAPILHYLSVIHHSQQRRAIEKEGHVKVELDDQEIARNADRVEKAAWKKESEKTKPREQVSVRSPPSRGCQQRQDTATSRFIKRMTGRGRDSEMERQRQRIEVLKQQLMDHKLRLLHQKREQSHRAIASVDPSDDDSDSSDSDVSSAANKDTDVFIRVSFARTEPDASVLALADGKHLNIRLGVLQTVLELKQRIEALTGVASRDQILISKPRGDSVGLRLCNDATIQQSVCPELCNSQKRPWRVLLLHRHGL